MSGMPLKTGRVFSERWKNKFYYKVASFWLFLLIHTAMHGSMNIKFIFIVGFFYLGVCSVIQLDVFILVVLFISASNVLLIDQLNFNYSSMRLDTVSAFGTSRIFFPASSCIEFYLVFDSQFLGFSISEFGCGRSIWNLNSSIRVLGNQTFINTLFVKIYI